MTAMGATIQQFVTRTNITSEFLYISPSVYNYIGIYIFSTF